MIIRRSHLDITGVLTLLVVAVGVVFSVSLYGYYVQSIEYDSDSYSEYMYRVQIEDYYQEEDSTYRFSRTPQVLAKYLSDNVVGIDKATSIRPMSTTTIVRNGVDRIINTAVYKIDSVFIDVFPIDDNIGDRSVNPGTLFLPAKYNSFLSDSSSIEVINPAEEIDIGEVFFYERIGSNSHLPFSGLVYDQPKVFSGDNYYEWGNIEALTYVVLHPSAQISDIQERINTVLYDVAPVLTRGIEQRGGIRRLELVHVRNLYTHPAAHDDIIYKTSAIESYYILIYSILSFVVSIVLLLTRLILNVNLGERSYRMHYLQGASFRNILMLIFRKGGIDYAVIVIFYILILLLATAQNYLVHIHLDNIYAYYGTAILIILALILATLYVSGMAVMRTRIKKMRYQLSNNNVIVIYLALSCFQLLVAFAVVTTYLSVDRELDRLEKTDYHYRVNNLFSSPYSSKNRRSNDTFMSELRNIQGVQSASMSSFSLPTRDLPKLVKPDITNLTVDQYPLSLLADYSFAETLQIELLSGRYPTPRADRQSMEALINIAAAIEYGWDSQTSIGKIFPCCMNPKPIVVGVTDNFVYQEDDVSVEPSIVLTSSGGSNVFVRLDDPIQGTAYASIDSLWLMYSNIPANLKSVAESYLLKYQNMYEAKKILRLSIVIFIIITTMAIVYLSNIIVRQSERVLIIRRIVGASHLQNTYLLLSRYTKTMLLLISIMITGALIIDVNVAGSINRIDGEHIKYIVLLLLIILQGIINLTVYYVKVSNIRMEYINTMQD